jgi:hypothetical protein
MVKKPGPQMIYRRDGNWEEVLPYNPASVTKKLDEIEKIRKKDLKKKKESIL